MLQLIKRCPEYVAGYKEFCQELYDHNIVYFRPTRPESIDEGWFSRTKDWYEKKEKGLIEGQSPSLHYWAVDGEQFIGEFQLRTAFTEKVLTDIGGIGYGVRVSQWGKGYGTEIIRQGLAIAKEQGMEKVLFTINEKNAASIHVCEKFGGKLEDTIDAYNEAEGQHRLRRYWVRL